MWISAVWLSFLGLDTDLCLRSIPSQIQSTISYFGNVVYPLFQGVAVYVFYHIFEGSMDIVKASYAKKKKRAGGRMEAVAPLYSVSSICQAPNVILTRALLRRIHSISVVSTERYRLALAQPSPRPRLPAPCLHDCTVLRK